MASVNKVILIGNLGADPEMELEGEPGESGGEVEIEADAAVAGGEAQQAETPEDAKPKRGRGRPKK